MPRPFIPAPNCASFEFIYSCAGEVIENILHCRRNSPYTLADLQDLRTRLNTWDIGGQSTYRASNSSLVRIRTRALDSDGSPMEDWYLPTPRPGVYPAGAPNNAALCVKLATGLTGRSQRGRFYYGPIPANQFGATPNQVNATFANYVPTGLNNMKAAIAAGGHILGVLSYRHNGAWRDVAQFTPATGFVLLNYNVDSQRRRLTGHGM